MSASAESEPLFCDRCGAELHPGSGDLYRVTIEAVADPAPPNAPAKLSAQDIRQEIEQLLVAMKDLSAQEAMDQVHRRLTLFLCVSCYRQWIEAPTG